MSIEYLDGVDLSEPGVHKRHILSVPKLPGPDRILYSDEDRNELIFLDGNFSAEMLESLIMPTMKGFWVNVRVTAGVRLYLHFDELIGLKNMDPTMSGVLDIKSKSMRSCELWGLKGAQNISIYQSPNLTDLSKLPYVAGQLTIHKAQAKDNLKHIINAIGPHTRVEVTVGPDDPMLDEDLTNLFCRAAGMKATKGPKAVMLTCQQHLIDLNLGDYAKLK